MSTPSNPESWPPPPSHPAASSANEALRVVLKERLRQERMWGTQDHEPFIYITILMEEVGELAQAILKARFENQLDGSVITEAIQTAAVALAIVECLNRGNWDWNTIIPNIKKQ